MTKFARLGLLLLPLILSGCFHRRSAPPLPPQSQAPAIPVEQPPANQPVQMPPIQATPPPVATTPAEEKPEQPKQTQRPKRTTRAKKTTKPPTTKPGAESAQTASASAPAPVTKTTQQASAEGIGVGSPIGQLTSGASDNSAQRHKEALQLIESTDQGINGLKRNLNGKEKETVTQIRVFLKQAKEALSSEDIDGAMNLANKAKVLLAELTK